MQFVFDISRASRQKVIHKQEASDDKSKVSSGDPQRDRRVKRNTMLEGTLQSFLTNKQKLCVHSPLLTEAHCVYAQSLTHAFSSSFTQIF